MTGKTLDADLAPRFPAGTLVGSKTYNKIAATNSMIDFFAKKDPSCVDRYFKEPYRNHNTLAPDGLAPVHHLAKWATQWDGVHTIVRRCLAEGDLVLLHSLYSNLVNEKKQRVAFDLFRFDDGKIVEHWDALEIGVPPDESGLAQIDGSVDIRDLAEGERNCAFVKRFVETVLIGGQPELAATFIDAENFTVHSPQRTAGLVRQWGSFIAAPDAPKVSYLRFHITLAEGNFVFVQGEGRIGEEQVLEIYDLFRLNSGKIVEHWDVLQPLAPKDNWANPNGPFGFANAS